jgi:predicted RNase H-like nuclease (RuvC/YqgF family)
MLAKFESVTSVDGVTMELPNGLDVDSEVFVENEEGELVPIQDGEYQVGDVTIVVVGGIIAEIKQADINEPTEEPTTEEPETLVTEEPEPTTEEPETNTEVEELKQKVAELEEENIELKEKVNDLEAKLFEPIEEPIEDTFKATEIKNESKIDYSKYINIKRK